MPKAASQIPTVPTSTNASLIDRILTRLTPKLRGNAGDARIGATAIENGRTLITGDESLANAVNAEAGKRSINRLSTGKIIEIKLDRSKPLVFREREIGVVERRDCNDRIGCLLVDFTSGASLTLSAAVDVSEYFVIKRIFVIEARPEGTCGIFGGERMWWLTVAGEIRTELPLFREYRDAEYWTTTFLEHPKGTIIICEGGVLILDDLLQVQFHEKEYYNDFFVRCEGNSLKFVCDQGEEWSMSLEAKSAS